MSRTLVLVAFLAALTVPAPSGAATERVVVPTVVDRAVDALEGETPHATLALRDLVVALPTLTGSERARARAILARPTDGADDPSHDGYTVRSKRDCGRRICVHWVPRTADAPPDRDWVRRTQKVLRTTWRTEIGELGYRRPLPDGGRGGNDKLDVYLKDVGSEGLYGYCVPERARTGDRWIKPGYCVLDDDFARRQFDAPPRTSLEVTAAHEFFHAVQFAYDYAEDRWLMEASATWVEERVRDGLDDNRQYLDYGQVRRPATPLDLFDPQGFNQYGNWAFLEHLSQRFGRDVVRRIWRWSSGPDDHYSTWAIGRALPGSATFIGVFRSYASATTAPGATFAEGKAWPTPTLTAEVDLSAQAPGAGGTVRIDHLAARHLVARPGKGLAERGWRLRVRVDGPGARSAPAAYLRVGRVDRPALEVPVRLDDRGRGVVEVRFDSATVRRVTVTLANASRRSRCWQGRLSFACQGDPRDDGREFTWRLRAFEA